MSLVPEFDGYSLIFEIEVEKVRSAIDPSQCPLHYRLFEMLLLQMLRHT